MKKDGKYRFTLQFGSDTEEQIKAGELLEQLGNKKSAIIVEALNDYMLSHPELISPHCKIEVKAVSGYNQDKIEQIIRKVLDERIGGIGQNENQENPRQEQITDIPDTLEEDIEQMLDNLDLFM